MITRHVVQVGLIAACLWAGPLQAAPDPSDPAARPPLRTAGPEEEAPAKDLLYDGNYTSVLGGLAVPRLDVKLPGVAQRGIGARLAGRFSTVTQFADAELGLEYAQFAGEGAGGGSANRIELGAQVAVHPGFPLVVFNNWWYDVASGVHLFVGAAVVRASVSGAGAVAATRQSGSDATDWTSGLTGGIGVDVPVSPRDRHSGWWLTLRYVTRWARFGTAVPDHNLGDGQWLALLGWRTYDNGWARLPRPF